MTTDLATRPETLAPLVAFSQADPVRSRVKYEQPLTNYEKLHPFVFTETPKRNFRIPLPEFKLRIPVPARKAQASVADQPAGQKRRPHPGDIFYWVATLGGVCLLLLCATR